MEVRSGRCVTANWKWRIQGSASSLMKSLRNYQRCGGGAAKEVFRIVNRPQRIRQ
jgi:hypothetical protein